MSSRPPKPRSRRRHSLSTVRGGGPIERGGDSEPAARLADALAVSGAPTDELTHPVHTWAARMHPATARRLIELVADFSVASGPVLDPFCGSGTTLVECHAAGLASIGVDLNPLAASVARAKTWTVSRRRREQLAHAGADIAVQAIAEGKAARRSGYRAPPLRRVAGIDHKTRDRLLGDWFGGHVRRELEFLAGLIDEVGGEDPEIAELLRVCLSAVLYKASNRASDTDASRVARRVARGAPARWFRSRVELLCEGLDQLGRRAGPVRPVVRTGDARDLVAAGVAPASLAAAVTSPPYVGTYDYANQHQLRMAFFGIDDRDFESGEIGARRHQRGRPQRRSSPADDMAVVFDQLARALVDDAPVALVIGDSLAGKRAVWARDLITGASREHFEPVAWAAQGRAALGAVERQAFASRGKREWIFLLRRRAAGGGRSGR